MLISLLNNFDLIGKARYGCHDLLWHGGLDERHLGNLHLVDIVQRICELTFLLISQNGVMLVSILFFFGFCIWGDIFASQYLFQQRTVASHRIFLEVLTDQVSLVGKGMLDNTVRKSAYRGLP